MQMRLCEGVSPWVQSIPGSVFSAQRRLGPIMKVSAGGTPVVMNSFRICFRLALAAALVWTVGCKRDTKRAIAMIPMGNAHMYWQSVHAGALKAAREAGVDVVWDVSLKETDFTGQLK